MRVQPPRGGQAPILAVFLCTVLNPRVHLCSSTSPSFCLGCCCHSIILAWAGERIPERVVHARGTGAHGFFESYGDLSDLTRAGFLGGAGRKTDVFVRFSTVIHSKGSPETLRDPRGFSVKFKIAEQYGGGVWDLVGNNLDVFFIRDQISFPDMVHSLKPGTLTQG